MHGATVKIVRDNFHLYRSISSANTHWPAWKQICSHEKTTAQQSWPPYTDRQT